MFRKLLSNLPFNPSLINQVSFYAKRVHSEAGVRRSGAVLMVLALMLQLFAVIAPPQPSLAASTNDIIYGGFTKKETAVEHCVRNTENFATIIDNFGVSCDILSSPNTTTVTIRSTDHGRALLSMGRHAYGKKGERPVTIGNTTYYLRYLWSWDSGAYSSYKALKGTNRDGQTFYILYNCGNIVVIENQAPPIATPVAVPQPKPKVEIVAKTTLPGTPKAEQEVQAGDTVGYRIYFRNSGDAAATNVFVEDETKGVSFVSGSQGSGKADRYDYLDTPFPGSNGATPHLYWAYYNFPAGATGYYVDFKATINAGQADGKRICNKAYIRSNQTAQTASNEVCHIYRKKRTRTVETTPVNVTPPGESTTPVVVPPATKPCANSVDANDAKACVEKHKIARNDTQNLIDANNTTAKPGDVITYTLTARNYGNKDIADFVMEEDLNDVMKYAEKVINFNGATMNDKNMVTWPAQALKSGETMTKQLTIQIKKDIPNTTSPASNPPDFDLMLTNIYGDTINIKLPGSVAVVVARANTTLPNTGPGTTVTIAVLITITASYFYARSRLMAKELDLVREDYATSGSI